MKTPAFQRYLTLFAGGIAIVSLVALAVILVQYAMSVALSPLLLAVGLYGLPLAFILLMTVLGLNFLERRKG
ncbi:hypothetical protein ACSYDW_16690 [Paeniglutamicibacter sp. R2-26]|uniref:hypothetical protein n=1 Tax=Paeniglutamicibacter sp. R2-26 TaxID=3144417 RepID=UPI003EE53C77